MAKRYKKILQSNYSELEEELDVARILSKLFSSEVINHALKGEIEAILKEGRREAAAGCLLNYLYEHFQVERFTSFVRVLRETGDKCPAHGRLAKALLPTPKPAASTGIEGRQLENRPLPVGPTRCLSPAQVCSGLDPIEDPFEESGGNTAALGTTAEESKYFDYDSPPEAVAAQDFYPDLKSVPEDASAKPTMHNILPLSPETNMQSMYKGPAITEEEAAYSSSDDSGEEADTSMKKVNHSDSESGARNRQLQSQTLPSSGTVDILKSKKTNSVTASKASWPNSERLGIVCSDCWFEVDSQYENAIQGNCRHNPGKPPPGCRPRTASNKLICCKHPQCIKGATCQFAHGKKELDYWKASRVLTACEDCLTANRQLCEDLLRKGCHRSGSHALSFKDVVYHEEKSNRLETIRCPTKIQLQAGKHLNHSLHFCGIKTPYNCLSPHNKVELELWVRWKAANEPLMDQGTLRPPQNGVERFLQALKRLCTAKERSPTPEVANKQAPILDSRPKERPPDKLPANVLDQKLTAANYTAKFNALIGSEMRAHEQFLKRCDGDYTLTWYSKNDIKSDHHWYLAVVMEHYVADNVRQAATHVVLKLNTWSFVADTLPPQRFTDRREPCLIIGLPSQNNRYPCDDTRLLHAALKRTNRMTIRAEFQLKRGYFDNLYRAVKNLPFHVIQKLTGETFVQNPPITADCSVMEFLSYSQFSLDIGQQECFHKIYSCSTALPVVIAGPFGTGKTRLIAASALLLLKKNPRSRILIVAHQKKTADDYIEKFFTEVVLAKLGGVRAVRLVGKGANLKFSSPMVKTLFSVQRILQQFRLIVTTFITSMNMNNPGHFTHIFVDEGAQAREPETVAAFRHASPDTKIIVAGDHMQVGPKTSVLGEEARRCGLSVSLLERLHALFKRTDLKASAEPHLAVLLNNYRCHPAILSFPSALFYRSSIKAQVSDSAPPEWKFPLQFVCSSLQRPPLCQWSSSEELRAAVEAEVLAARSLVQRCADHWPPQWGRRDLSLICVMVPARYAEWLWKNAVQNTELRHVTVAVTFSIQGLEYRAVFVCTSEPVNKDFSPFDPVQSICDPCVFNTIVTRSQSLVVAVGNPFRLIEIEENLVKQQAPNSTPEDSDFKLKKCWLSYLKRCWEANAVFEIFSDSKGAYSTSAGSCDGLNSIMQRMVEEELLVVSKSMQTEDQEDTILTDYDDKSSIEASEQESSSLKEYSGWNLYSPNHKGLIKCRLLAKNSLIAAYRLKEISANTCLATTLGNNRPPLLINGTDDRRCAFDGATVSVTHKQGQRSGVVVGVMKQGDTRPLICTVERASSTTVFFVPSNSATPKLLAVSEVDQAKAPDSQCADHIVFCFDHHSLSGPRKVTHAIPLDVAVHQVFLVQALSWSVKDKYPSGAAIAVLPKGTSLPLAETLLRVSHGMMNEPPPNPFSLEITSDQSKSDPSTKMNAFAVVQGGGMVKCAFSVESGNEYYHVKFHVPNVVGSLALPGRTDVVSWQSGAGKCLSVERQWDILPNQIASLFTLAENRTYPAITLEYKVPKASLKSSRGEVVRQSKVGVVPGAFSTSVLHCEPLQMEDLQDLISSISAGPASRRSLSKEALTLFDKVTIFYALARQLHHIRIGHNGYHAFELGLENLDARTVVAEFLIQADYSASQVLSKDGRATLQKRQLALPGQENDAKLFISQLKESAVNKLLAAGPVGGEGMSVPAALLLGVVAALYGGQVAEAKQIFCRPHHHAPSFVLVAALQDVLGPEEWFVPDKKGQGELERHVVHHSPKFTNFTSPFESVANLYTQETLLAILANQKAKSSRDTVEMKTVANLSNKMSAKCKAYQKAMSDLELAFFAQMSSVVVEAYVKQNGGLAFCFLQPNLPTTARALPCTLAASLPAQKKMHRFRVKSTLGPFSLDLPAKRMCEGDVQCTATAYVPDAGQNRGSFNIMTLGEYVSPQVQLSGDVLKNVQECFNSDPRKALEVARALECLLPQRKQFSLPDVDFATVEVPLEYRQGESFSLWLGSDPSTYLLSLRPQCFQPTPGILVCLQHLADPLACFSGGPVQKALRESYSSLSQYRDLWTRAVLAASAEIGVTSTSSTLLYKNVLLKFSPLSIKSGDPIVTNINADAFRSDLFVIDIGDLACARYEVPLTAELAQTYQEYLCSASSAGAFARGVLHMVVQGVCRQGNTVQITFRCSEANCSISPLMRDVLLQNKVPCDLEVISMTDSLRNSYKLLASEIVERTTSILARSIAMGNLNHVLQINQARGGNMKHLQLLQSSHVLQRHLLDYPRWIYAVDSALNNPFHLINLQSEPDSHRIAFVIAWALALRNKSTARDPRKCVLLCSHTNDAAVEFVDCLAGQSDYDGINVLLIHSPSVESRAYPTSCEDMLFKKNGRFRITPMSLHCLAHKQPSYSTKLANYEKIFRLYAEENRFPSLSQLQEYKECTAQAQEEVLSGSFDLVICTANEAASQRFLRHFQPSQAVLYDAGVMSEPESFSAIHRAERVVMIGGGQKGRQPDATASQASRQCGMDVSMFERLCTAIRGRHDNAMAMRLLYPPPPPV